MDNEVTQVRSMDGEPPAGADEGTEGQPREQAVGPGTVLGNYRLDRLLAEGFSSQVFQAANLLAGRPCAVKVFRPQLEVGAVSMGRFAHEVRRVVGLDDPNIADVYFCGWVEDQVVAVTNVLSGTPLNAMVRQNAPLSRRNFLPVVRAICEALSRVHDLGLCHGHLHGGQVLVTHQDRKAGIQLLDFGTHHLLPGLKEPTPDLERGPEQALYVSPEQIKGNPPDARSDVYALSVMLYEMITGRVPFMGDTFEATLDQHLSEAPVPPGKVGQLPPELEEALLKGLEKDPRKRTPSVEALYAALDPRGLMGHTTSTMHSVTDTDRMPALMAPGGAGIQGGPPPIPGLEDAAPQEQRGQALEELVTPRKKPWIWIALALVLLCCGGALAYFFVFKGEEKPLISNKKKQSPPAKKAPAKATPAKAPVKKDPVPKAAARPKPRPAAPAKAAPALEPTPSPPAARKAPPPPPPVQPREPTPRQARVSGGVRSQLAARADQLQRVEGFGSLRVITGSPKAQVFVDGNLRGTGEVLVLERIAKGLHRIHLVKGGKKTPHQDITVGKDQIQTVSF